jgi:hypothetical protein
MRNKLLGRLDSVQVLTLSVGSIRLTSCPPGPPGKPLLFGQGPLHPQLVCRSVTSPFDVQSEGLKLSSAGNFE